MAVTKISPVKTSVKKTLDYIMNPHKTEGKVLMSGHACAPETAYLQFEFTKKNAGKTGGYQGFHLIQSFSPGEVDFDAAHEIGKELADKVFGGKFAYVVATHTDRQHVHNHIVINSVSYKDKSKYNSSPQSYYCIRRASDTICHQYGLSVIDIQSGDKGRSYKEYAADKAGVSWKSKLRAAVDNCILKAGSWEEFLSLMEAENYEIKQGKHIAFRAVGQERFTRSKTLGAEYSEDRINERIRGISQAASRIKTARADNKVSLMIDIENSIKAQQSKGFEYWAKLENLKTAAKTLNFITENKIGGRGDLLKKVTDCRNSLNAAKEAIKSAEKRIKEIEVTIHNIEVYRKTKPVIDKLDGVVFKDKYRRENESDFILFAAADKALRKEFSDCKLPLIKTLRAEQNRLKSEKPLLYSERDKAYSKYREIKAVQDNIDLILGNNTEAKLTQNRPKNHGLE